ncbi:MAG TPA: DUF2254 family protein [Spirochaetota bacterium]|nr:DUF2254 family protein [Spirochaetota bacterium]
MPTEPISPGVNDPGTAIDIISTFVRLFSIWINFKNDSQESEAKFDKVRFCTLSVKDMFDDAFTAIERDGSSLIEVTIKLIKSLSALSSIGDEQVQQAAAYHAKRIIKYAEQKLVLESDINNVRDEAQIIFSVKP